LLLFFMQALHKVHKHVGQIMSVCSSAHYISQRVKQILMKFGTRGLH
jgi:hypothetical protein